MRAGSLTELMSFAAVAEELSFRRAAVRMNVSPSALSHTIRRLEERLEVSELQAMLQAMGRGRAELPEIELLSSHLSLPLRGNLAYAALAVTFELVTNALKYRVVDFPIRVTIRAMGGRVELCVISRPSFEMQPLVGGGTGTPLIERIVRDVGGEFATRLQSGDHIARVLLPRVPRPDHGGRRRVRPGNGKGPSSIPIV
ncbi:hypothetical protein GCM10022600_27370 [Qipengyuania pelagi]|uniref:LysR family transcriptional regulator n=1 Tax=Qipengyuania pelagi TaxID=994320 RepID=A0A844Y5V8_9SPHN|nr:LysR family transcriptional regulator [Qipengyuania pelagi]MXO52428.1 LysR family transcriptional regulator [Qipengyuania pelagi]